MQQPHCVAWAPGTGSATTPLIPLATPPPTPSQEVLEYCYPLQPTADAHKCVQAVQRLTCPDVNQILGALNISSSTICHDARALVDALTSPVTAENTAGLLQWYENVLAPCIAGNCAGSPYAVTAEELKQAPRTYLRNVIERQLTGPELFLYKYGIALGLVMLGIIVVLVVALIVKKSPCPSPPAYGVAGGQVYLVQ